MSKASRSWMKIVATSVATVLAAACHSPAELPVEVPVGTELGMRAPLISGLTASGADYADAAIAAPSVVVFYRSASCGLCRIQLADLQRYLPSYRERGVRVLAVTLDPPEMSRQLRQATALEFEIVSVDTATFADWHAIDSASGTPLPVTYLLDSNGVVRFRHLGRNVSDRALDAEVLTVLETLGLAAAAGPGGTP